MRTYEYRHIVGFEETNLVGNVYYVNHLKWQGRCRELFLREHAPELLDELSHGLALVTTRCACEYLGEIFAFDEILVRMSLAALAQNRMDLHFDYVRVKDGAETLIARGDQQVVVMRKDGERMVAEAVPARLREALLPYREASSTNP